MELDDFLEHHGIRGQKWGVRRNKRLASGQSLSSGNKALVVGGGLAAAKTLNLILRASGGSPMGKVGAGAVAVGGALVARDLLKRHQQKQMAQLKVDLRNIRRSG